MQRIFLIGYMGAGKTTLGKALAQTMNLQFIDLDDFITGRHHKTIKDIFAEVGEDGFRQIERNALHEVSEFEDVIISLGGGTPCFFDNMDVVNAAGKSVYLKPSEDVLLKRLIKGKHKRPLLADKSDDEILQFIRQQLAWREPFYLKASLTFNASHLENKADIHINAEKLASQLLDM
ncbi:MAG: shikimate kinase [Bacteroidales bacterium]|nr:shikimate kinase [Candidatus Liminaster caballi]